MNESSIVLGRQYRDRITGLTGIAVSESRFLWGCNRVAIQPQDIKDGRPIEQGYFDAHQLVETGPGIEAEVKAEAAVVTKNPGGVGDQVPRSPVPTRR
jgi:hypothetical protein